MKTKTCWESFKAEGENVVEKMKQIVHEGNVRRVLVNTKVALSQNVRRESSPKREQAPVPAGSVDEQC